MLILFRKCFISVRIITVNIIKSKQFIFRLQIFVTDRLKSGLSHKMKKFKKHLMIIVPEDQQQDPKSPTHLKFKQNKQKPLLLYNQHTIHSSANNEDDLQENERQLAACQQFSEFHGKNSFQTKNTQKIEVQLDTNKIQRHKKFNVIEFQEFCIQKNDRNKSLNQSSQNDFTHQKINEIKQKSQKKSFSIEIPQNTEKQQKQSMNYGADSKNDNQKMGMRENMTKQPPAPSNKSSLSKTINRHFVFPTNDEQSYLETIGKKIQRPIMCKVISQEQHEGQIRELNQEWSKKLEGINKAFEKQRQQFYKQKSSLEKDLMIKDGQIEMLQKLITNRYSPKENNQASNFSTQLLADKLESSYRNSLNKEKTKASLFVSDEKINSMETILLEKDLQINTLMQKINELNKVIDAKNNQLEEVKIGLMKNQKMNESLRNQIFLYEKKEQSENLSKQFYKMKQSLIQVQQSSKTPKGFSRQKWQEDVSETQKSKDQQRNEIPFRGIDDLHKRLESLKMNRIQLQNRGRIKSEIGYPLTSKTKAKGTFDFKGKAFDRERDYIGRTGLF